MKLPLKRALLTFGVGVLVCMGGASYFLYRISKVDEVTPLRAKQNVAKEGAVELSRDNEISVEPYLEYLKRNAKLPVEYVVEKFKRHDVVLLGEAHQVREDCELISELIEPLYRCGVTVFAMEVLKQKYSDEITEIASAKLYDENRVTGIFRENYFYWGFKEYMDIIKSVWTLNSTLADGQQRFEILGLMPDIDVYGAMCGSFLQKLGEFPILLSAEESYARPLMDKVLDKKKKALVQIGYNHTFSRYRQAKVVDGKMLGEFVRKRFGRVLDEKYGNRVFQIALHVQDSQTSCSLSVMSFVEQLYRENSGRPIGFDVQFTPFGNLRDTCSSYFKFQKYVTLSDIAQGYIIQKPFVSLTRVEWLHGFVDSTNFDKLRTYALQRGWITATECKLPTELDAKFAALLKDKKRLN